MISALYLERFPHAPSSLAAPDVRPAVGDNIRLVTDSFASRKLINGGCGSLLVVHEHVHIAFCHLLPLLVLAIG